MDPNVIGLLYVIARGCVPAHLRSKIGPDDIVQDTLVRLHQSNGSFEGRSEAEQRAYVRKVFVSVLADRIRQFDRSKRSATLERSLDTALDESSARLEHWLVSGHSSPSSKAARGEQLLRLAEAIAELPDDQRRAIELHHLEHCSLADAALRMNKTQPAVAGLIRRAMKSLRERLTEDVGS
jgi:RNA polymerase sigma-70 factor (ECF subfamily)